MASHNRLGNSYGVGENVRFADQWPDEPHQVHTHAYAEELDLAIGDSDFFDDETGSSHHVSPQIEDITLYIDETVLGASTGLTRREAASDAVLLRGTTVVLAHQGNHNDFVPIDAFINTAGNDRPMAERLIEPDASRTSYQNRYSELASTIDPSILALSHSIATRRSGISTMPSTASSPLSRAPAPVPVLVLVPVPVAVQDIIVEERRYACPFDKRGLSTSREHMSNCKEGRNSGFQHMGRVREHFDRAHTRLPTGESYLPGCPRQPWRSCFIGRGKAEKKRLANESSHDPLKEEAYFWKEDFDQIFAEAEADNLEQEARWRYVYRRLFELREGDWIPDPWREMVN